MEGNRRWYGKGKKYLIGLKMAASRSVVIGSTDKKFAAGRSEAR